MKIQLTHKFDLSVVFLIHYFFIIIDCFSIEFMYNRYNNMNALVSFFSSLLSNQVIDQKLGVLGTRQFTMRTFARSLRD